MDTNSIYTIHSLGSSISFILFVVDIETKSVYFICLNDYIDKISLPKNPIYIDQGSVTITIPTLNKLSDKSISRFALEFYGKRAKLLSAFAKFAYQKNELTYLLKYKEYPVITKRDEVKNDSASETDIKRQVLFFIEQIEGLDIWSYKAWEVLPEAKKELLELKQRINNGENLNSLIQKILITWHRLTNLGNMYEEFTREWFLPKFLSFMISYPNMPDVVKKEK